MRAQLSPQRCEESISSPNLQLSRKWLSSIFQTLWDPGVEAKPKRASSFHRWFSVLFHRPDQNLSSGYSSSQVFEIWGPCWLWIVQFCPFESWGCAGLAKEWGGKSLRIISQKSSNTKSGSHSVQEGQPSTFLLYTSATVWTPIKLNQRLKQMPVTLSSTIKIQELALRMSSW